VDLDKDGYYNWGIGPKPKTCPACPDEVDCDDSDPNKGPYIDSTGFCKPISTGLLHTQTASSGINHNVSFDPVRRVALIRFRAPDNAKSSVAVYNLSGVQIKNLVVSNEEQGLQQAIWNSTSEAGVPVSEGVYVCRVSVDNANAKTTSAFKIAIMR